MRMLPCECWQEVLSFCTFVDYAFLAGLRSHGRLEHVHGRGGRRRRVQVLVWRSAPASREFYLLLKQAQLEMRLHGVLPSACMGGLWMASRAGGASQVRSLKLGACGCVRVFVCVFLLVFSGFLDCLSA